jgi:hypothetical protein
VPRPMRAPLAPPPLMPSAWRGPAVTTAMLNAWRPVMPPDARFALFRSVREKPLAFTTLAALARRVHAERAGRAVELSEETVDFKDQPRAVVAVHTLGLDGMRDRLVGYAWLDGARPRERLEGAVDAQQPRRQLQDPAPRAGAKS